MRGWKHFLKERFSNIGLYVKDDTNINDIENHIATKWLILFAIIAGSIIDILSPIEAIYRFAYDRLTYISPIEVEYGKIESLSIGNSIDYIKDFYGEPQKIKDCNGEICDVLNINDVLYYDRPWYELELYISDKTLNAYTILVNSDDFTPLINMQLTRFSEVLDIYIGKSAFSVFDKIEEDSWIIENQLFMRGAYTFYYGHSFVSTDYANKQNYVFSHYDLPDWGDKSNVRCNFKLVNEKDNNQSNEFKDECLIKSVTVVNSIVDDVNLISNSF